MEAVKRMRQGEECDLLDRLSAHEEFALSKEDMEKLLDPRLYTGRCAEQAENLLKIIKPYISDGKPGTDKIEI